MTRIVIFNIKHSPNLGDGVIAECLEHALRQHPGIAEVVSADLAGRDSFQPPRNGQRRAAMLAVLDAMPAWSRELVFRALLGRAIRARLRPKWQAALRGADFAVFGGGQLIQDGDLNFPLKLAAAAAECRQSGIPVGVYAVGVARSRSFHGRALLADLLAQSGTSLLSVRDAQSVDNLASYGFLTNSVSLDPGLLASRVWPAPTPARRLVPLVGFCITHPSVLRHHASDPADVVADLETCADLYRLAIERTVAAGYEVCCFTNGAGEDELMLQLVRGAVAASDSPHAFARFEPRPGTPGALARLVAGFDVVVAHRLHAAILAVSYGVPAVGLRWDDKLTAFFAAIGQDRHTTRLDAHAAEHMGDIVAAARRARVPAIQRDNLLSRAAADVAELVAAIEARTAAPARQVPAARDVPVRANAA